MRIFIEFLLSASFINLLDSHSRISNNSREIEWIQINSENLYLINDIKLANYYICIYIRCEQNFKIGGNALAGQQRHISHLLGHKEH